MEKLTPSLEVSAKTSHTAAPLSVTLDSSLTQASISSSLEVNPSPNHQPLSDAVQAYDKSLEWAQTHHCCEGWSDAEKEALRRRIEKAMDFLPQRTGVTPQRRATDKPQSDILSSTMDIKPA